MHSVLDSLAIRDFFKGFLRLTEQSTEVAWVEINEIEVEVDMKK